MFQSPESGAEPPKVPPAHLAKSEPKPEKLRHMLFGSQAAIKNTIHTLHKLGYAEPNDWTDPLPTDKPDRWMVILTKNLLIE
ncbi:MAG TPA: hypothetical protein V6D29_20430 [Leptolyngbyaceae cyanobacterium]